MCFGLKGALSTFVAFIDTVLQGLGNFTQAYIDDILEFTDSSIQDHVRNLLDRLHKHKIKLKPLKCHFVASEIKYLGHDCFKVL